MAVKKIQKQLKQALIHEAEMSQELYDEELAEYLDEFKQSLLADHDEYLFSVIEDSGRVAMVLIEQSGAVHINSEAKRRLKEIWGQAYLPNMNQLIPSFAQQLDAGEIPMTGVKTVQGPPS